MGAARKHRYGQRSGTGISPRRHHGVAASFMLCQGVYCQGGVILSKQLSPHKAHATGNAGGIAPALPFIPLHWSWNGSPLLCVFILIGSTTSGCRKPYPDTYNHCSNIKSLYIAAAYIQPHSCHFWGASQARNEFNQQLAQQMSRPEIYRWSFSSLFRCTWLSLWTVFAPG